MHLAEKQTDKLTHYSEKKTNKVKTIYLLLFLAKNVDIDMKVSAPQ